MKKLLSNAATVLAFGVVLGSLALIASCCYDEYYTAEFGDLRQRSTRYLIRLKSQFERLGNTSMVNRIDSVLKMRTA